MVTDMRILTVESPNMDELGDDLIRISSLVREGYTSGNGWDILGDDEKDD